MFRHDLSISHAINDNKTKVARWDQMECTILPEEPETLDADQFQEEVAVTKLKAERPRPGLTMLTDRSRFGSRAARYSVVWQNGQCWVGLETGLQPGSLRRGDRALTSTENCYKAADGPRGTSSKTKTLEGQC